MSKAIRRIAFVTGATSGIGKQTAKIFAKKGYDLIITGRRAKKLEKVKANLIEKYANNILTLEFDVRNYQECENAIVNLPEEWKAIDILINNAGLAKGFAPIQSGSLEDWNTMIDTNVKGLLHISRLISSLMVSREKGHIINVCSTAGHEVYPNGNVYCATKHAVDAITKSMRLDLYKHHIRVSQVSPGHVEETEFASVRFDGDMEKANIYNDFNPLTSKDVAEVIYFIASRKAHVNIQDVLMMGTQQANSNNINRIGRIYDKMKPDVN